MTCATTSTFRNLEDFAGIASDWFWETDHAHRFTYFSTRMEEVTRLRTADLLGRDRVALAAKATSAAWQSHLDDLAAHRPFRDFEYEVIRPSDGSVLWLRTAGVPRFDADGTFIGYRGTGHDITREKLTIMQLEQSNAALAVRNRELHEARHALEQAAYHDILTGLPNRRAFEHALEKALGALGIKLALLHLDLDRFKWVNDTLGHPCGDILLATAAQRVCAAVGDGGQTYRVGGDEFMVLLTRNVTAANATRTGNAIVDAMTAPIDLAQRQVTIGISVGIAFGVAGQDNAAAMTTNADVALYEAKRNGRNQVCTITPQVTTRMQARRRIAATIPAALQRGEFVAYFQPQADALSGDIIGAEALVRWCHPDYGLMKPGTFLDLATEMGMVEDIDRLMLRLALDAMNRLHACGLRLPSISVNISAPRLMDPRLPDDVASCWTDRQCSLSIELLETIYFDDRRENPLIKDNLRSLRDMGVEILTDDFGSGRASITGLLKVRPDRLKIERNLIRAAVSDPQQRKVVAAILEMTRALGIEAMAEGVESAEDITVVRGIGCRYYQGNALAPALSEDDFVAFLSRHKIAAQTKTAGRDGLPLCV
ncbi:MULTISPECIES: putative bifunctional diguanylate cyclase/phosphodiesterase [unclassified Yoonia]|uniref:putative bifunctional diguanylate cyclase/phosphodiesterase n=1 Tax=unclassified Yoonia TaxID=2629118 RepID=UPI002AFF6BF4|nr:MULTISPECIES: EAL domain-containing protein [unclassified Yoonia]